MVEWRGRRRKLVSFHFDFFPLFFVKEKQGHSRHYKKTFTHSRGTRRKKRVDLILIIMALVFVFGRHHLRSIHPSLYRYLLFLLFLISCPSFCLFSWNRNTRRTLTGALKIKITDKTRKKIKKILITKLIRIPPLTSIVVTENKFRYCVYC